MKFKDVEHLFRLAGIFLVGLLVFAIARAQLVPEDFGKFGHYRAGAVDDARVRPIVYGGQKVCADCHEDIVTIRAAARHKSVSCETCHGPLARHAEGDGAKLVLPDVTPLCIRCHAEKTGKPTRYPRVDIKDHAGDDKCVACHKPHDPRIQ